MRIGARIGSGLEVLKFELLKAGDNLASYHCCSGRKRKGGLNGLHGLRSPGK